MKKLSENMTIAISFIAGVIFYNAIVAIFNSQFDFAFLSFIAIIVVFIMLKYTNWEAEAW